MENESLLSGVSVRRIPPTDRWNGVWSVFFILGVGSLLPWNFFMNAKQYFMYKLRNTTISGSESWLNATFYVDNQRSYESYLEVAAMVPAIVFMFLNVAVSKRVTLEKRISVSLALMSFMFLLTVIATRFNTDQWQQLFLTLSLISVSIMNAGSAVLQGAICGLASYFPTKYMQAIMTGQGLGGVLASIASIVTIWLGSGPVQTGFSYFLIALVVTLGSFLIFFVVIRLNYYRYHVTGCLVYIPVRSSAVNDTPPPLECSDVTDDDAIQTADSTTTLIAVLKQIWLDGLGVFLVFFVTLSCFPGVSSLIQSVSEPSTWTNVYFVPVICFLLFNVSDVLGRSLSGVFLWPRQSDRVLLTLLSLLRLIFVPVFLLSNIGISNRRLPSLLCSDTVPIIANFLLGITNGYLGTLAMMYGPQRVGSDNVEVAGAAMSFFLSVGLGSGALVSVILVKSVI